MTTTDTSVNNGVNVEALLGAASGATEAPEAAQFQWRRPVSGHDRQPLHRREASVARSSVTAPCTPSTPITPRSSLPKTMGSPRSARGRSPCGLSERRASRLGAEPADPASSRFRPRSRERWTRAACLANSDVRNGFSDIKVTYDIDADASPDDIRALVAQRKALRRVRHYYEPHQCDRSGSLIAGSSHRRAGSVRATTVVIGAGQSGLW